MKHFLFFSALIALSATNAYADQTLFATEQAIGATTIATLQHTITQNLFSTRARPFSAHPITTPETIINPAPTYNQPIYGSELLYGEYNDDGTMGRNGGDTNAPISNIWLNWQHTSDDINLNNFNRFDSRHDIATIGFTAHDKTTPNGFYNWTFYGGYINGTSKNSELDSDENGGFIGILNKLQTHNFIINSTINTGFLKTDVNYASISDNHTNIWFGAMANIAYNLQLDDTFSLYPMITAGYTWIKNETKNSTYSDDLQNQTFGFFEVTPALNAVKHIGNNWYGTLGVKYVMLSNTDKNITINDTEIEIPTVDNYTEYGISLEKQTNSFAFKATIGRHDGDLTGWIGDLNIKYIF